MLTSLVFVGIQIYFCGRGYIVGILKQALEFIRAISYSYMSNKALVVIYVAASTKEEAEKIASNLVETKLAACCNIVQGINSIYFWDGKVNNEGEVLMVIKSRQSLIDQIGVRVKELHSYKVPQVIALPIVGGSSDYINWVLQNTLG